MLPFFLYLLTGLLTGFHLYTLLALTVYGAPLSPLELVAFLGSAGLLVAAYTSLFRSQMAARVALIAALAIWSFYGPAIAKVVRERTSHAPLMLVAPSVATNFSEYWFPKK